MTLHEDKELFAQAVQATAQRRGIPEIYIEKDYWVTVALKAIFTAPIGKEAVFKGGTALSKCYRIVDRFSEDVDMVVLQDKDESGNKLKNKLKKISKAVEAILPEVEMEGITNKLGMIRKTAHSYAKQFQGNFGQVRDTIIIESTWLGSYEPYEQGTVSSFIADMMFGTGQEALVKQYGLEPFQVRVLSLERTFCEKIMSLMRFSFTDDPITDLNNKIRHVYDIHKLLENEKIQAFFESGEFDVLLRTVAGDDVVSFKNNNNWLQNHPVTAKIYADIDNTWEKLRVTYNTTFRELVYADALPSEEQIKATLERVSAHLKQVDWEPIRAENFEE